MENLVLDWFAERKDSKISCFNKRLSNFSNEMIHVMLRDTSRYIKYIIDPEKKMRRSIEIVQIGVQDKYKRQGVCTKFIQFLVEIAKKLGHWDVVMIESVMSKELTNLLESKFKDVFVSDKNCVPNYYCLL